MTKYNLFFVVFLIAILLLSSSESIKNLNYANAQESVNKKEPIINDPNLKADLVANGLELPTGMAFLGPNDILVIEKEKGTVQRIIDGKK
ncbi:MAG: yliI 5 [Nitrososphaeraceae archaeon]|nr:yliI 5 [Nitrososphaeraceae archaeon]